MGGVSTLGAQRIVWAASVERLLLVATGVALVAAWTAFRLQLNGAMTDYRVFDLAGDHWRAPYDQSIYFQPGAFGGKTADAVPAMFAYPPTFLLLAKPFSLLPYGTALLAWVSISYGAFLLAASYLHRRAAWLLVVVPFAFVLAVGLGAQLPHQPVLHAFNTAQTSLWVGAGLIGAGLLLDRRPLLAGALLAAVACLKPTAVLAAPFVLWGRWRAMFAAIAFGLGGVALTLPLGPHLWLDWLQAGRAFEGGSYQLQPQKLFDHPAWTLAMVLTGAAFAWRDRGVAGLLLGAILCTPYMMPYDLAALCALGGAWLAGWRSNWPLALIGAALSLGLAMNTAALTAVSLLAILALTLRSPTKTPS
jgi:hypothetical protein